ncbi:MAG: hypothetical protein IT285_01170 [Bdellovibrionales bacterium]|nr:hypothetical protein [Bdellovibrionales bacterium]
MRPSALTCASCQILGVERYAPVPTRALDAAASSRLIQNVDITSFFTAPPRFGSAATLPGSSPMVAMFAQAQGQPLLGQMNYPLFSPWGALAQPGVASHPEAPMGSWAADLRPPQFVYPEWSQSAGEFVMPSSAIDAL